MRRVKRWRYYCDHCRKSTGTAVSMRKHEVHCTANPGRSCRACGHGPNEERLRAAARLVVGTGAVEVENDRAEAAVELVRRSVAGCPACTLAAIRLSGAQWSDGGVGSWVPFDYKAAKDQWKGIESTHSYTETLLSVGLECGCCVGPSPHFSNACMRCRRQARPRAWNQIYSGSEEDKP